MIKTVNFQNEFLLPSVGTTLPAGNYSVTVEDNGVVLHGHHVEQLSHKFHIPAGVFGENDPGAETILNKGELEKALAADRAK